MTTGPLRFRSAPIRIPALRAKVIVPITGRGCLITGRTWGRAASHTAPQNWNASLDNRRVVNFLADDSDPEFIVWNLLAEKTTGASSL